MRASRRPMPRRFCCCHNLHDECSFRVATYNIHKGVQGVGPARRLEIHNIGHAVEQLDADIVCLQEVRKLHRREERYFTRWPELPQAEFLAPDGYDAVYQTNATTRTASTAMRCCRAGRWSRTATRTCPTTASSSAACCT